MDKTEIGKDDINYKPPHNDKPTTMIEISSEAYNPNDKIEIDNAHNSEKEDINYEPPHNGNPITMIEISPEENYLVTYSLDDDSIFGWNINSGKITPDNYLYNVPDSREIGKMCVSDDKKLAYIYNIHDLEIIDMKDDNKKIKLDLDCYYFRYYYCTFNLKREIILFNEVCCKRSSLFQIITIYSTQKKNRWTCKRMYEIPEDFKFISVSKYSKLYLLLSSNNHIYEWNLLTEKGTSIFNYEETIELKEDIRITSNEKFVCLKIKDKIIIYSIELEIPIIALLSEKVETQEETKEQTADIESTTEINLEKQITESPEIAKVKDQEEKTSGFTSLLDILFPLLNNKIYDSIMAHYQEDCKTKSLSTINYIFGILDGSILKIKLKVLSDLECLIVHPLNLYTDDIELRVYDDSNVDHSHATLIFKVDDKWERKLAGITSDFFEITFLKNNESKRIQNCSEGLILGSDKYMLFKNNDVLFELDTGVSKVFIYHFNENSKKISLCYYHSSENSNEFKDPSKSTLLLPNHESFKQCNEWVSDIIDNRESLLKYGVELFSFAIRERNFKLIDEIYKQCIHYFNEDQNNNKTFLSIITVTMPLLNKYYPEFILKYSLETNMIIDSQFYNIEDKKKNLHLYSKNLQLIDLTRSVLWTKYNIIVDNSMISFLFTLLVMFLTLPILPVLFFIFYLLLKHHFVNDIDFGNQFAELYFSISEKISKYMSRLTTPTITPTITFMIPYIKFVNYPKDYNWFLELVKPQPSSFAETINGDIYKTWNGEALINFKWNTYGKYYYAIIWITFIILLGCFATAATIPQQNIDKNIQNQLFTASIVIGFIHLSFEIRQFIYSPKKWIRDFWNIFDIIAYLLPIITSIECLQTNDMNDHIIQLLSFSCLFLDIKFLLFFRAFESFGIYFEIIINVAKQIIYFLIVLFIIIISFAHAFYILLLPRSDYSLDQFTYNTDPNNPWNIAPTFNQIFNNGTMNSFFIQKPDENTNMFINYRTALLAMYNVLTGDSSALSNWSYLNNRSLVILIVLFSLLVVVYLMNLFIGLLNMAINKDNERVSYLKQKAEILAEIELFYLLPHQRRWVSWFPEVIYYYASVDKTREEIKRLISRDEWKTDALPEMKEKLFEILGISDNIEEIDKISDKIEKIDEINDKINKIDDKIEMINKIGDKIEMINKIGDKIEKIDKIDVALQQLLKEMQDFKKNNSHD